MLRIETADSEREFEDIDFGRLLKMCIVHDLGEAIGGDVAAVDQDPDVDKSIRRSCRFRPRREGTIPLFAAVLSLLCTTCQAEIAFETTYTSIQSRGLKIPVTFVHPIETARARVPLVVMAHGHGGSRNENGVFTSVANALAKAGIASIRMDFSGCGDSSEPFDQNNLTNMLADFRGAYQFATQHAHINGGRVGALGYSMGGRVVLLATREIEFDVLALWAPAGSNGIGSMTDFLGGHESYQALRSTAESDGFATFRTRWGQDQNLGLQWFSDLETTSPLDAARSFGGPLLILHGDSDDVISPSIAILVAESAVNSSDVVTRFVENADHGLGFFDDDRSTATEVVGSTVRFIRERL